MAILSSQRHRFEIPDDVTYLNCAYMSPLSKATVAIGQEALARKAQPWTLQAADFFSLTDRTRTAFASLLGAPAAPDDIALVPAASYGMAVAARNLPLSAGE
ncbi:MAG: aminotransferase, partial [Gemmatimonadales bacterium]